MAVIPRLYRVYKRPEPNSKEARENPNLLSFAFGTQESDTNIILKIEEIQIDARHQRGFGPTRQIAEARAVKNQQNNNIRINHLIGLPVDDPTTTTPQELWRVIDIVRTSVQLMLSFEREDRDQL